MIAKKVRNRLGEQRRAVLGQVNPVKRIRVAARLPPRFIIAPRHSVTHLVQRVARQRFDGPVWTIPRRQRRHQVQSRYAAFGGRALVTRADHPTGTDRLAEAAAAMEVDVVVNVQGDEPLIEPEVIDAAAAPLIEDPSIPMGTLMARIRDPEELHDPNLVKVVVDQHGFALYFSRAPIPYARDQAPAEITYYYHPGLYVYRKEFLLKITSLPQTPLEKIEKLEQLRAIENDFDILVGKVKHTCDGIDTPEQYAEFVKRYKKRQK